MGRGINNEITRLILRCEGLKMDELDKFFIKSMIFATISSFLLGAVFMLVVIGLNVGK